MRSRLWDVRYPFIFHINWSKGSIFYSIRFNIYNLLFLVTYIEVTMRPNFRIFHLVINFCYALKSQVENFDEFLFDFTLILTADLQSNV